MIALAIDREKFEKCFHLAVRASWVAVFIQSEISKTHTGIAVPVLNSSEEERALMSLS